MADRAGATFQLSGRPPWHYAALAVGALAIVGIAFVAARLYLTRNDLPGCAEAPTRQSLATIFRENNVAATGYDEMRQVSRSDGEVACAAVISLADGSKLDVTYRMLREQGRPVVRASWRPRS